MQRPRILVLAVALAAVVAGCGSNDSSGGADKDGATTAREATGPRSTAPPRGSGPVDLDPADFTTRIDNPYWPMTPGSRWVYRETDAQGRVQHGEITVMRQTKMVAGVRARVVHDRVTRNGKLVEDTFDWFAQDRAGNIWYLGEDTREYQNGKVSSAAGSWQAGVDGAQAGVLLPGSPRVGQEYRQEYREGEAEDAARVLSVSEQVQVPVGHFASALLTKDFTPLEPDVLEYKLYARGVGLVLALGVSGGASREELVRYEKGGG